MFLFSENLYRRTIKSPEIYAFIYVSKIEMLSLTLFILCQFIFNSLTIEQSSNQVFFYFWYGKRIMMCKKYRQRILMLKQKYIFKLLRALEGLND